MSQHQLDSVFSDDLQSFIVGKGQNCCAARPSAIFLRTCVLAAALLSFLFSGLARADVDIIYVVAGSHFDVGFNDLPSLVREHRIRAIDDAIAAAGRDPDFHWTEDGGWGFGGWLERYRGDASRIKDARRFLRNGQLSVSAVWVNPHASAFWEYLGLLTSHLDELEQVLHYRPAVAILNDSPSYPEAIVDALAACGVRYVLVGPNMAFTRPLPEKLVRTPFWWESAKAARVLVYIDPDSYLGVAGLWGIDPDAARFFHAELFPRNQRPLETMQSGIRRMLGKNPSHYNAVIVQHACDDCSIEHAKKVAGFMRMWNREHRQPVLVSASAADYFRHIEARYGSELPVYRGEWGGQWDNPRAGCPVWTWRLREAMKVVRPDSPAEMKIALATAMDHGLGLGPGWPGMFTEEQTLKHAGEQALVFARAVEFAAGKAAMSALPPLASLPRTDPPPPVWQEILSGPTAVRLRAGQNLIQPFVGEDAPVSDALLEVGADMTRFIAKARIDRSRIPGSDLKNVAVVMEFPLRAPADKLRVAPEGSPSALAGRWLLGEPPPQVVAPEGLRVIGLAHALRVRSPEVFVYTLVPDRGRADITWLQALLVRQSTLCEFRGKKTKAVPFEVLYPGEPKVLDVTVELEILR